MTTRTEPQVRPVPAGRRDRATVEKISIIVPNYNYEAYVGHAVESALAVIWPQVEVIVVDDGSTDGSMEVLAAFGDRITLIRQENAGPRAACNTGFAVSTGDVVIFLDSDDVLEPFIALEVAMVWRPGISKVQVQMLRIDGAGAVSGRIFPAYRSVPSPEQVRHWMTMTGAYPTPPGSGNVYAREFLERLFPLDDRCGDSTDSACLAAAPYLGDVLTIPKPLVRYRLHGRNRSNLRADPRRFAKQIDRAYQRHLFAASIADRTDGEDDGSPVRTLMRGRHLLQMRVAANRVRLGEPIVPMGGRRVMMRDAVVNVFAPGPETAFFRVAVAVWCLTTLCMPAPLARWLIRRRFR